LGVVANLRLEREGRVVKNRTMHLSSLVEMVESGFDDRVLLGTTASPVTGSDLGRLVRAGASTIAGNHTAVVYAGENHPLLPVALLAAAWAGVPFVPINYRLADEQLNALVARQPGALVLADPLTAPRLTTTGVATLDAWLDSFPEGAPDIEPPFDDDEVAIVLFTSGTTSEPKAALLRPSICRRSTPVRG
jgi:acyl-CoA synthetase (AMP-forming)/AMP-acid ligase II